MSRRKLGSDCISAWAPAGLAIRPNEGVVEGTPPQRSALPKQREMRMRRLLAWSAAGASVRSKAKGSAPKLKVTGEKESMPATG